jgi:leucyl aminopeptidase (aminopeptidase T)
MDAFLMMRGARKIVEVCAAVKPGERVLIVTDSASPMPQIAEALAAAAHERDAEVVVTVMSPREGDGAEPPAAVVEAMKASNVALLPVSYSISHSEGVRSAMKTGCRVASLVQFTRDMMIRGGIEADFHETRPLCDAVARMFTEAEEAVLTSPGGTNLRLSLKGRTGNSHPCIVDKPGKFTAIPNVEANVSPVEGFGEGTAVFDGSIPNLRMGVVDAPVVVTVKGGSIVDIDGGRHADILRRIWSKQDDPSVYNIAQLAVGLNPECTPFTGVWLNDHGAYGTVHLGIGTSASLGGHTQSSLHFDGMMYKPTLTLDGRAVLEDGEVVIEGGNGHKKDRGASPKAKTGADKSKARAR